MAIDYTTDPTGIFRRGGKLVKFNNAHLANATTTLPAQLVEIADKFENSDLTPQILSLYGVYRGMQNQEVANRQALASFWNNILLDVPTVVGQLNLPTADLSLVLPALFRQMVVDGQTVQKITTTIGAVAAGAGNVGNGTVLLTKRLDGQEPPAQGAVSLPEYAGLDSEFATNETMVFVCTADSGRDGRTPAAEAFDWSGKAPDAAFGYNGDGSGVGPGLTVGNGQSLATDGDFELWTGNTPTYWAPLAGTLAGTHLFQENSVVYRGGAALKLTGDGALATVGVSQAIPGSIRGRRMVCVSLRMRCSAVPAAGSFDVKFSGTGYTPGAGESISVAFGSMPTSYTLYNFFAVMPNAIPSDMKLLVQVSGTLSNTKSVYVDSLSLNTVPYHGGVGAVVVAGSTPFQVGDRFTAAVSESAETVGVFQRLFRRKYQFQLPSSGAPTIGDALGS
jgi:hypothetical protein